MRDILNLGRKGKKLEDEADIFAACLMMPEKAFRHYWSLTHSVDDMATIFCVPYTAINFRLKMLNLLEEK